MWKFTYLIVNLGFIYLTKIWGIFEVYEFYTPKLLLYPHLLAISLNMTYDVIWKFGLPKPPPLPSPHGLWMTSVFQPLEENLTKVNHLLSFKWSCTIVLTNWSQARFLKSRRLWISKHEVSQIKTTIHNRANIRFSPKKLYRTLT